MTPDPECLATDPIDYTAFGGLKVNAAAMARKLGISGTYLWRILSGDREPKLSKIRLIANMLGMDLDTFFNAVQDRRASKGSTGFVAQQRVRQEQWSVTKE